MDAVGEPDATVELGQHGLTAPGLRAAGEVGLGGERFGRHAGAAPDGRDAQQIRVEAGPATVPEIQDQTARGEVVGGQAVRGLARVDDGGEEREIRFDPVGQFGRGR